MLKIVVYSDNPDRQEELIAKLKRGGLEPAVDDVDADVLLIDTASGEEAALAVVRANKEGHALPVLMIFTSRSRLAPEILEDVADFVVEPYGEAELWARLKRLGVADGEDGTKPIIVNGLVIHPDTYEALLDGKPLSLTFKEYELLRFLASHPERVWDRQTLLNKIWDYDYFGGTRTVDVHVRRVRSKLGRYADLIQTVRQVGYKFSKNF